MQLRPATKSKSKLRVGFAGPSGSGKTYSALLMASGMTSWDKICVIDTENMSADLYSDLGAYNVITLESPYSPERYIEAIKAAESAGMEVIIVDSVTHEWDGEGGALQINEKLANTKFRGNTWAAWSETTPRHQAFIYAITNSKCHVITTARSKTDTIQTEDKKIKKVGLKEIQREGFEYELTANFTLDRDSHCAIASKDRTSMFIDADPFVITPDIGAKLLAWANTGLDTRDLLYEVADLLRTKQTTQTIDSLCRIYKVQGIEHVPYHDLLAIRNKLRLLADKPKDEPPVTPPTPTAQPEPPKPTEPVMEPVTTQTESEAAQASVPMATAGDLVLLKELIIRRAMQLGKDDGELKNQLYAKVGISDLSQLTKSQAKQLIDMLTDINTKWESEHQESATIDDAAALFGAEPDTQVHALLVDNPNPQPIQTSIDEPVVEPEKTEEVVDKKVKRSTKK